MQFVSALHLALLQLWQINTLKLSLKTHYPHLPFSKRHQVVTPNAFRYFCCLSTTKKTKQTKNNPQPQNQKKPNQTNPQSKFYPISHLDYDPDCLLKSSNKTQPVEDSFRQYGVPICNTHTHVLFSATSNGTKALIVSAERNSVLKASLH